jgi:nicotinamidase-related amidase
MRSSLARRQLVCEAPEANPQRRRSGWCLLLGVTPISRLLQARSMTQDAVVHGNSPQQSVLALLLVDMINDLEFVGGDQLLRYAAPASERAAALKQRARAAGIPVIYANDNFGRWRSDFRQVVEHCLRDGVRGQVLTERLQPLPEDYFVLKPRHSAFFATPLELVLEYLGARTLIVAGFAADMCVLLTAADAYLRHYKLYIPQDCSASQSEDENRHAFAYMERVFKADITASVDLDLRRLAQRPLGD